MRDRWVMPPPVRPVAFQQLRESCDAFASRMAEVRHACERVAATTAAVHASTARFRALREAGRWPT